MREQRRSDTLLAAKIAAALVQQGCSRAWLAAMLGWSDSKLYRKCRRPGSMTVDELRQLRRALRLSADELAEVI